MNNENLFLEGGNMFPDCVPIHQENVAATWDDVTTRFIQDELKLNPDTDVASLGSTGKKLAGGTSGDMDIAIDYHKLQEIWELPEWDGRTRLPEWVDLAQDAASHCGVEFNKAGTVCSLRWPIVNDDGGQENEFIQVDLMPTLNMKMTTFGKFSQAEKEGETFFKGTVRNIMLSIMARCSYHKDLTEDTHIKVLPDGTEKEVHNEYEGWTYDGNTGLHLCHKKYEQYTRNGKGYQKGDWKPHAVVVSSPVISDDPDEIVEMIFGKGVTPADIDSVQKMWRAWKNSPAVKENPELVDEVRKQIEKNGGENQDIQFPDFDGEEFVNEARVKKSPEEKVNEYMASLSPEQIEKLTTRCEELLDKWGEESTDDQINTVMKYMGHEEFLSMMKKVVPLKEPTVRDMGANTFVSKFFDLPFDAEAYLGKVAKEQGIPYAQAKQEWERSNLDKTHLGRYAHMIADDAVNGKPPRYEGENVKEVAVYTAIYDYATKLIEGASDVESEVSLHAKDVTVGGKFDLMFNKNGKWYLVDWKTNGENLDDIPTGKMGIEDVTKDLNNNSYNKYALQLNVYEWAAKNSGKIPMNAVVNKELHHFHYDEGENIVNIKVVRIPDMQELVQAMVDRAVELGVVKSKEV